MSKNLFKISITTTILIFTTIFCLLVVPLLLENPDIIGAFAAGFVNHYVTDYSTDVFCCWAILAIWVIYVSPRVQPFIIFFTRQLFFFLMYLLRIY